MSLRLRQSFFFFFNDTATTEIYTLSLHDALPIYPCARSRGDRRPRETSRSSAAGRGSHTSVPARSRAQPLHAAQDRRSARSEEHTSELQSPCNLVCRLLLEKKTTATCPATPIPTS